MTKTTIKRVNFHGDWNEICKHCGKPQETHKFINGPWEDGIILEHRIPCEKENMVVKKRYKITAIILKILLLIGVVVIPLTILTITQMISVLGWVAFGYTVIKLSVKAIEILGYTKWIPGHKRKEERQEKKRKMEHYYYHCERNPNGFHKIKEENLLKSDLLKINEETTTNSKNK